MQHLIKKPKTSKTYKGQKKHNSAIKTHTKKYGRGAPIKRDWSTYNRELINRGNIEVWIPKGEWYATEKNGRRGRDSTYSSSAFLAAFSLKELLGLTYRATEGFINSLMRLQGRDEKSPSYSRLCQVFEGFSIPPFRRLPQGPVKLLVDSTGIKVMGEGEWRRKKHGIEKSRKWVKLHLGFDYETGQVLAAKVTPSQGAGSGDCSVFPELLKQLEDTEIGEILADGAYDKKACYQAAEKLKAWLITPPMQGADYGLHPQRDRHIKTIEWHDEKVWKERVGYGRRSLAETGMSRLERLFGMKVSSRTDNRVCNQLMLRVRMMNMMTNPHSQVRNACEVA